jgi:hypothetical protein
MQATKEQAGELETWAIVEVMGHQRYAGYVRQVPLGGAVMIRVDVPELPEKEETYVDFDGWGEDGPKQLKKTRMLAGVPAFTKFLGVSAIFSLTPCTEEMARAAVERWRSVPATELAMPVRRMLPGVDSDDEG